MVNAVYNPVSRPEPSRSTKVQNQQSEFRGALDAENLLLCTLVLKEVREALKSEDFEAYSADTKNAASHLAARLAPEAGSTTELSMSVGPEDDGAIELILDHATNGRRLVYLVDAAGEKVKAMFVGGPRRNPRVSKVVFALTDNDIAWVLDRD